MTSSSYKINALVLEIAALRSKNITKAAAISRLLSDIRRLTAGRNDGEPLWGRNVIEHPAAAHAWRLLDEGIKIALDALRPDSSLNERMQKETDEACHKISSILDKETMDGGVND